MTLEDSVVVHKDSQAGSGTDCAGTVEQLIKSRERVKAHGEVFTPRFMVDKMLDLVKEDLETGPDFVDKTFFEPAAGDGNFLLAILQRKLRSIAKRFPPNDWANESLFALASIYGVEILADNHHAAQVNLLKEFVAFHEAKGTACSPRTNLRRAAKFLIESNVRLGNTLTGLSPEGVELEFSWWNRIPEAPGMVKREPFTLNSLRAASTGAFDFAVYDSYKLCRIDHVHKEVKADD